MTGTYAANTGVPVDRSRAELERILSRYGATGFMYGWQEDRYMVAFEMRKRRVRFLLPMPERDHVLFTHTPQGRRRTTTQTAQEYDKELRRRWRALVLVVKAKLEAIESEITDFETEFLAYLVLPDNSTVGQFLKPQIADAYEHHQMPALLPIIDERRLLVGVVEDEPEP